MILRSIAKMLIQEHRYRRITGRVLCLGPQLVPMPRREVDALFARTPEEAREALRRRRTKNDDKPASDQYFFNKFPIERLDSLDVVEGYGGTIIHDLNTPIPGSLCDQFDFIVDGGTFDHLLNIGIALHNVVKMLRPGGRVFQYNAASNYLGTAYVSFGPDLFYDYYVLNGFVDCKVYIARETSRHVNGVWELFYVKEGRSKQLNSAKHQMVIVLAEKGDHVDADRIPVQYSYRSAELRPEFQARQREIAKSRRPLLQGHVTYLAGLRERWRALHTEALSVAKSVRARKFELQRWRKKRRKATTYVYVGKI